MFGGELFEEGELLGVSGVELLDPLESELVCAGFPVAGVLLGFTEKVPALVPGDPDEGLFFGGDECFLPDVIVAALFSAVGCGADGFCQLEGQGEFVVDGGDDEEVVVAAVAAEELVASSVSFEV